MHNQIVIGASAGGVEALIHLVRDLSPKLQASIYIVVHFPAHAVSALPQILSRSGPLPAQHATNGEKPRPGHIYIAPPDRHLLFEDGHMVVAGGPREHGLRPAVDPLFHSAGKNFKERTVGIILTGTLGDGVSGLQTIKTAGGLTVVQDPEEAVFRGMPSTAIERVAVDRILPLAGIAALINELDVDQSSETRKAPMADQQEQPTNQDEEINRISEDISAFELGGQLQNTTMITCPDCGGVIWEMREGDMIHYRCHVGHAYSPESLLAGHAEGLEEALWTAVRLLEERASLVRRISGYASERGGDKLENRYLQEANDAERKANIIRRMLLNQSNKENGSHEDGA